MAQPPLERRVRTHVSDRPDASQEGTRTALERESAMPCVQARMGCGRACRSALDGMPILHIGARSVCGASRTRRRTLALQLRQRPVLRDARRALLPELRRVAAWVLT